jgi:hypothetical protein
LKLHIVVVLGAMGFHGNPCLSDGDRYDDPVPEDASVVLYSRRTCGLCDAARAIILSERSRVRFRFEEVLIDGDDMLEGRYGLRVPVVEVDGVEEFEYVVDAGRLRGMVT